MEQLKITETARRDGLASWQHIDTQLGPPCSGSQLARAGAWIEVEAERVVAGYGYALTSEAVVVSLGL